MAQENSGFGCKQWCWLLALLAGVIAAVILHHPLHWVAAIIVGALVCLAMGWLLTRFFCSEQTAIQSEGASMSAATKPASAAPAAAAMAATAVAGGAVAAASKPAATSAASDAPAPAPESAGAAAAAPTVASDAKPASKPAAAAKPAAKSTRVPKPSAAAEPAAFVMQPTAALKGQDELAAQKGSWTYDGNGQAEATARTKPAVAKAPAAKARAAKPATAKPAASKTAAAKPAAAKAAAAKPAAAKAPAAKAPAAKAPAAKAAAPAKPAATRKAAAPKAAAPKASLAVVDAASVAAAGAGKMPRGTRQPRNGRADDLKLIEGIGPVLEEFCNEKGIFHFDQIAAWGPSDVAWMDQNIPRFPGRVSRDKWVAQARLIGDVGIEEFLIRAKTNNY